jgi:hypothetical protein
MKELETTERILQQGQALVRAIEALETVEPTEPIEDVIYAANHKRRLTGRLAASGLEWNRGR